jgi:hypothetical protein
MVTLLVQSVELLGAVENAATTQNEKAIAQNPARCDSRGVGSVNALRDGVVNVSATGVSSASEAIPIVSPPTPGPEAAP